MVPPRRPLKNQDHEEYVRRVRRNAKEFGDPAAADSPRPAGAVALLMAGRHRDGLIGHLFGIRPSVCVIVLSTGERIE
jgi:hypothetical protein